MMVLAARGLEESGDKTSVCALPIPRRAPHNYTDNLYRVAVYLLCSSCERFHAAAQFRTCFWAGVGDPCSHRPAQAAFARARGKARSHAVAGFRCSAVGEGWFGRGLDAGACGRHAPAVYERGGCTIAGGRVGPGRPRSEGRTSDADVSHAQVSEVAPDRQGRETGLVDGDDFAEAFRSRAGEASYSAQAAGTACRGMIRVPRRRSLPGYRTGVTRYELD